MLENIESILQACKGVRVLVVGDVILDRYWWGGVSRISPEAPVPVVSLERTSIVAGGAANVAANIAGLGAVPIVFGITGDDAEAALVPGVLNDAGITDFHLVPVKERRTTLKTRIIAHSQQVVRIDQESVAPLEPEIESGLLARILPLIENADLVVISDYSKGFLTAGLLSAIFDVARKLGKIVLIDPKGKDYTKYAGATLLTPNVRETADVCGREENDPALIEHADALMRRLSLQALLVTQGEHGMTLLEDGRRPAYLKASARKVYDVTGAGDTVIASLAVGLGSGLDLVTAAEFANLAAGLAVERVGTTAVTADMIREYNIPE